MYLSCEHKNWIDIISQRGVKSLHYGGRFKQLVQSLDSPRDQYPGFVSFVGNVQKDRTLSTVFPKLHPRRRRKASTFQLYLDADTKAERYPVFIADVTVPFEDSATADLLRPQSHTCTNLPIAWPSAHDSNIFDVVAARLLLPWCDALCVFADDCGGSNGVSTLLRSWAKSSSDAQSPSPAGPHVLVVGDEDAPTQLLDLRLDADVAAAFTSVSFYTAAGLAPGTLQTGVQKSLEVGRQDRLLRGLSFSAIHQDALFFAMVSHFCRTVAQACDLLTVTRTGSDWATGFESHISHVFAVADRLQVPQSDVRAVLASALLLDALPHGAHGEVQDLLFPPQHANYSPAFPSDVLFRQVYEQTLFFALSKVLQSHPEAANACTEISRRFDELYTAVASSKSTAATKHLRNMRDNAKAWANMQSTMTCLCCLRAPPEHALACGHSLCEACLRLFSADVSTKSGACDQVRLETCVICGHQQGFVVKLKPPTAGIRILSIDGGGIKGIVPLEILTLMQESLGAECQVQDLFDLCIGTSAGGLIALKVFLQCEPVAHASIVFKDLSRQIFSSGSTVQHSLMSTLTRVLKTISRDELYDGSLFDKALISQFGLGRLFDHNPESGTRVGVVATAVNGDTSAPARVFSNYSGTGCRNRSSGYRLQRSDDARKEALVWQAARATAAAPGYFRPAVTSFGAFQDGCMVHNNPVNIALWESRVLWPTITKPDVVLSLGTCTREVTPSPIVGTPKLSIRDAFPFRIARTFWTSMDGQATWRDLMNRLDPEAQKDFFRLSIEYPGQEPAMDDHSAMDGLASAVRLHAVGVMERAEVLMALLVSSLFFELSSLPVVVGGRISCEGFIRCRTPSALRALLRLYPHGLEVFHGNTSLAYWVDARDICGTCNRYSKRITFTASSLEEIVEIGVRWDGLARSRFLSGMPQKLSWFVHMQGLHDVFGRLACTSRSACLSCSAVGPSKRRCDVEHSSGRSKRRRR
ncbi:hypothetical protein LTR70_004875 [Exophiala xenobiotica]|uniref:PNPLA domain-containing protein n=1 Tax=Lithohypha guttulata TaxID=1690604 RepID=A0ABR0KBX7_9EURO|nr:hypothetical protein LTR24_004493 [Lithohypha guttulata]KAK5319830.1 hypothetical protein LTR70_004875 [Exophiala xenobiotica]